MEDGALLELGRYDNWTAASQAPVKESVSEPTATPPDVEGQHNEAAVDEANARHRRRFTTFAFRRRTMNRSVAGPAIAVLDAEVHAPSVEKGPEGKHDDDADDVGVRVTIRLSALDADGKELSAVNAQVTYLHVVRFGAPPVVVDGESEEDTRPWVVKVVKREATVSNFFSLSPVTILIHSISLPSVPTDRPSYFPLT